MKNAIEIEKQKELNEILENMNTQKEVEKNKQNKEDKTLIFKTTYEDGTPCVHYFSTECFF